MKRFLVCFYLALGIVLWSSPLWGAVTVTGGTVNFSENLVDPAYPALAIPAGAYPLGTYVLSSGTWQHPTLGSMGIRLRLWVQDAAGNSNLYREVYYMGTWQYSVAGTPGMVLALYRASTGLNLGSFAPVQVARQINGTVGDLNTWTNARLFSADLQLWTKGTNGEWSMMTNIVTTNGVYSFDIGTNAVTDWEVRMGSYAVMPPMESGSNDLLYYDGNGVSVGAGTIPAGSTETNVSSDTVWTNQATPPQVVASQYDADGVKSIVETKTPSGQTSVTSGNTVTTYYNQGGGVTYSTDAIARENAILLAEVIRAEGKKTRDALGDLGDQLAEGGEGEGEGTNNLPADFLNPTSVLPSEGWLKAQIPDAPAPVSLGSESLGSSGQWMVNVPGLGEKNIHPSQFPEFLAAGSWVRLLVTLIVTVMFVMGVWNLTWDVSQAMLLVKPLRIPDVQVAGTNLPGWILFIAGSALVVMISAFAWQMWSTYVNVQHNLSAITPAGWGGSLVAHVSSAPGRAADFVRIVDTFIPMGHIINTVCNYLLILTFRPFFLYGFYVARRAIPM